MNQDSAQRIHILGASGSGTSTLGRALAGQLPAAFFDTDDYFWQEKYTVQRPVAERLALLAGDLDSRPDWVLSGSLCGWGDPLAPRFSLVVFLYLPPGIRLRRLEEREFGRYGEAIVPGGRRHDAHREFMDWAARYDAGGPEVRSRRMHEDWLAGLGCPVLRIEGEVPLAERLDRVLAVLQRSASNSPLSSSTPS
jgi:adenylate kinase family enzyme